jgi:hypothetical protein
MNSSDDRETELRRRERELQQREAEIRLRELEAEIHQKYSPPPLAPAEPETPGQLSNHKLIAAAKFFGLVVATIVAVRVATMITFWLPSVIIGGAIAWVAYKLFFESDQNRR